MPCYRNNLQWSIDKSVPILSSGKIGSVALYGIHLQSHYNTMRSSMKIFGMPISEISFDSGIETFLDITLDY